MIHTYLNWSTDISKAPHGEMVTTTQTVLVKGQPQERQRFDHVPTKILALTKCGKVTPTYWIPGKEGTLDGERWSGLNRGEAPLAWCAWPDADELMASIKDVAA
jgi:hypothetical protein